jgi:DNA-binding CsgD family transcriptional regulator
VTPLLDRALDAAAPTGELQRIGRVAAARAEYAWLRGDMAALVREADLGLAAAQGHDDRWMLGELYFWKSLAGAIPPVPEAIPAAYGYAICGDWRASASEFLARRMPFEQAIMLLAGDTAALAEAGEIIDRLGAAPLRVRLAEARKNSARGRAENPCGLTNRELEILRLLATGLTNAELARRLYIATKTIDHHVSAVLGKLQVRSRAQAVTVAHELGLMK